MSKGYGIPCFGGHFKAYDGDLVNKQFYIMKLVASGVVDFATAETQLAIGVLQNKPEAAGWPAEVTVFGETKLKAGGSISAGQFLVPDANGAAVAVDVATLTTNVAIGRALEDADSGDIFRAFVQPSFIQVGSGT